MIFKKTPLQGNFIFSNGEQALFVNGHYETEDEARIAQLEKIYEKVDSLPAQEEEKVPAEKPAVTKGIASSATLAALTKSNT